MWFGFFVLFWLERNLPNTSVKSKKTLNQHFFNLSTEDEGGFPDSSSEDPGVCILARRWLSHSDTTVRGNRCPSITPQPRPAVGEKASGKATRDETHPHFGAVWQETGLRAFCHAQCFFLPLEESSATSHVCRIRPLLLFIIPCCECPVSEMCISTVSLS